MKKYLFPIFAIFILLNSCNTEEQLKSEEQPKFHEIIENSKTYLEEQLKSEEQRQFDELIEYSKTFHEVVQDQLTKDLDGFTLLSINRSVLQENDVMLNKAYQLYEQSKIDDRPTKSQQDELLEIMEKTKNIISKKMEENEDLKYEMTDKDKEFFNNQFEKILN
jgi:hypothetical protein